MAASANTIITRARVAFPEMGATIALDLLNDAHAEFLARYPIRQDTILIPLTAGTGRFQLLETAIQIEAAYYFPDAANPRQLAILSEHELDEMNPGWRADGPGHPQGYYLAANPDTSVIGFYPKASGSTIAISTASAATPIQITTATAHGLTNGAYVYILGVATSTAANGFFYAQYVDPLNFRLYADPGLTTPVGSGVGGTGGYLIAPGSPGVRLHIRRNQTLIGTDTIPSCLLTIEPYVYSVCRRWAEMTLDPMEWQKWQRLEHDAVHKMELYLAERAGQSAAVLKPQYVHPRRVY